MKQIVDRIKYQSIKKFSYEQMQNFLMDIYLQGHQNAMTEVQKSLKPIDIDKAEIEIREVLRREFQIGKKRYETANMKLQITDILKKHTKNLDIVEIEVKLKE